ncbi:MAG: hypothetical protein HFI46_05485 [Lachnospiraceae bacterium]|nr:hypothetical protein [Lachnospiraceae bacterium]
MERIDSLKDIIEFNSSFKMAINLYLSLNKTDKVLGYIPTKSSVGFMGEYAKAVIENKEQATLLVGPYGKGKSHLLLVFLAVLSLERTQDNAEIIDKLIEKIREVDEVGEVVASQIKSIWNQDKFLPVLITDTTSDLKQAFLYGLNDALKRERLMDLIPDTYYSFALERLNDWEKNYSDTYEIFEQEMSQCGISMSGLRANLKMYSKEALDLFKTIYPKVTAGSEFNPMVVSDVLPLYKSISEKLVEEYKYRGIYIVFDEFSKFIESQNGIAVGANMKLLQDICELATDSHNAQVYFTMIAHKSIKEYGKYLSQDIINSFTGIEGRIIEKYFVTSSKNNYELIKNAIIKKEDMLRAIPHYERILGSAALQEYYQLPAFRSNFIQSEFDSIILKGCYPLNPIAAYLLLNVSEKIAQNERTLFTFISNDEPHSMARFVSEHSKEMEWSIGADLIYDYFSLLLKKEVSNEYVHNIWLSAEYAIEKCESEEQKKLIKALAIVLIVNKEDEIPATGKYLRLCVNVGDGAQAVKELEDKQLICIKSATGTFVFKTRAGSELRSEIKRQKEIKGDNVNYAQVLLDVTGKYHIIPRKYNTVHMMTRFFVNQYMNVDNFLNIDSSEALLGDCAGDGKVITLFSFSEVDQEMVKQHLFDLAESRLLVVCPKKEIRSQEKLKEYEIIQELRNDQIFTSDNEILKRELPLMIEDLTVELELSLGEVYEDSAEAKVLYFDGKKVRVTKTGNEESVVNECCENVYTKTPVINNEMVNRSVIGTAQTRKARVNIIHALLSHTDTEEFYEGSSQEATVYRSLFCVTKIVNNSPDDNIRDMLQEINEFVDSCSDTKGLMTSLITKLTSAPYGMRAGLIPFYLAYSLANRREDVIVYFTDKEIQLTADIVVNMCNQPEDYAIYISKEDLQKEKYIRELNILFQVEDNRNLSANRIKDIFICMQRWFRALPQVSRNVMDLERYVKSDDMIRAMREMRKAMQKVEFNPFESLFVTFPEVFQSESLEAAFRVIDECKTYYDDYFDWVQAEAISKIYEVWGGKRKKDLFHCLMEWYANQSKRSKQGLYDGRMTNFMSAIETLDVYSDTEVAKKVVKSVTDVYIENWNTGSLEEFVEELNSVKKKIESIRDEASAGELTLSFTRRNGKPFEKTYSHASESTGSVLRNIIEDTLEEYDDLSVNDRVSILLEMIEKITK